MRIAVPKYPSWVNDCLRMQVFLERRFGSLGVAFEHQAVGLGLPSGGTEDEPVYANSRNAIHDVLVKPSERVLIAEAYELVQIDGGNVLAVAHMLVEGIVVGIHLTCLTGPGDKLYDARMYIGCHKLFDIIGALVVLKKELLEPNAAMIFNPFEDVGALVLQNGDNCEVNRTVPRGMTAIKVEGVEQPRQYHERIQALPSRAAVRLRVLVNNAGHAVGSSYQSLRDSRHVRHCRPLPSSDSAVYMVRQCLKAKGTS